MSETFSEILFKIPVILWTPRAFLKLNNELTPKYFRRLFADCSPRRFSSRTYYSNLDFL